jgi:16S rRNA (guanine527-N7)-methyltransferase
MPIHQDDGQRDDARHPSTTLTAALRALDLSVPGEQVRQLDQYRELLWQWNAKLNLTRHTDFDAFAGRDVLDSQQLARWLDAGEEVLDVGSGGGVPGIILAILRSDLDVSLCESVQKKARALHSIVDQLQLPVAVHHSRAESLLEDLRFDTIVARAVGPLWKICSWFRPHWHSFGRLLLIKGPRWVEERAAARERGLLQGLELRRIAQYRMPGTESHSVVLQLMRPRDGSG